MRLWGPGIVLLLLFVLLFTLVPGCTTEQETNFTTKELGSEYLGHANLIHDYRALYGSKTEGKVRFLWKAPALYRMESLDSPNRAAGTLATVNKTTAVRYDAEEKTYNILPEIKDLPTHDYQAMVQRIVRDGQYTIIGRETVNGHACYVIEVIDESWSMRYTPYVTTRIQAWIDPSTGLVWDVRTFYGCGSAPVPTTPPGFPGSGTPKVCGDAEQPNNEIHYESIDVNTGMSDDEFSFIPPEGSSLACGHSAGTDVPDEVSGNVSPALRPGCNTCTQALLTLPMGGFNGDRFLIDLYRYEGTERIAESSPSGEINYTFYARSMDPGKVRYRITRVANLYETQPIPFPEGVTVRIEPDEFEAEPGQTYISRVNVTFRPDLPPKEMIWLYIHANVEGVTDAVTDDWVRVAVDDGSFMSGMGLYHFYTGSGGYCQDVLVVPQGTTGRASFSINNGELDTGTVTLRLIPNPCSYNPASRYPAEQTLEPEGIRVRIEPDQFIGRSFATYLSTMSFTVDKNVTPGDYCYSAILRKPMGGWDYPAFMVRVVPGPVS
jgi:outer membrane lipoprotein-sorting protein